MTTQRQVYMSAIEYRKDFPLAAADIATVFDASGIRRPTHDLARIERMFANANLIISAWHDVAHMLRRNFLLAPCLA